MVSDAPMKDLSSQSPFFPGTGPMAALMRAHDWAASALGPAAAWPPELHTLANLMLATRNPVLLVWGPQALMLYNDAYLPLLGKRHPVALGQPFAAVWPSLWPALEPIFADNFAGTASHFEEVAVMVPDADGAARQHWYSWSHAPVHGRDGNVAGIYNSAIDITGRVMGERQRQFEDALLACTRTLTDPDQLSAAAGELLGQRLRAARVGYAEVERGGRFITMRSEWTDGSVASVLGQAKRIDSFGPRIGEQLRAGATVCIDDVRSDPRSAAFSAAFAETGVLSVLAIPLLQDALLRAVLIVNDAGPRRWTDLDLALARSVVEHTWTAVEAARSQQELRLEQEQSRYILDNMEEGFALIDADWTLLQVNEIAARISRLPRDQLVGRSQWDAMPKLLGTEVEALYRRVHAERKGGVIEHLHTYPDGKRAWIEIRAYPSLLGRLAIFFRDISTRKAAEQELTDASRRKDEFLAMLAHELRNPLAPIGAAADLLSIGKFDAASIRQTSAVIARQVRHMTSLVDDLLDVSRVTRGLVALEQLELDAKRIVADAIEQVRPAIDARRQHFSLLLPPEPAYVRGDHKRLVQVLTNLLNNAAKYTPEGGSVVLQLEAREGTVAMTVSDNGIGMAPELAGRAFELFAQAERTSDRSQGGLGLGLALVKSLIELHGGSVTAYSSGLGQGSEFAVILPRIDTPAPPSTPERRQARDGAGHGLRLLIVDDNADAASMLAMFLDAAGFQAMVEHAPRRALERARLERPRVCLLDIGLPEMDGNELARRLRAQPETAGAVLVAITGYGQEQDRRKSAEAGFDFHFVKPVDTAQLIRLLSGIPHG